MLIDRHRQADRKNQTSPFIGRRRIYSFGIRLPPRMGHFEPNRVKTPHQGNPNTPHGKTRNSTRETQNLHQGSKPASKPPSPLVNLGIPTPSESVAQHSKVGIPTLPRGSCDDPQEVAMLTSASANR